MVDPARPALRDIHRPRSSHARSCGELHLLQRVPAPGLGWPLHRGAPRAGACPAPVPVPTPGTGLPPAAPVPQVTAPPMSQPQSGSNAGAIAGVGPVGPAIQVPQGLGELAGARPGVKLLGRAQLAQLQPAWLACTPHLSSCIWTWTLQGSVLGRCTGTSRMPQPSTRPPAAAPPGAACGEQL